MLDTIKQKRFPEQMLKHIIFFSLFAPLFLTSVGSPCVPDIILVNGFVFLFLLAVFLQKRVVFDRKSPLSWALAILLLLYNLAAIYVNLNRHWFLGQLNVALPFLLFLALLSLRQDGSEDFDSLIRFFIQCIVISNLLGLAVYAIGLEGLRFQYGSPIRVAPNLGFGERRFDWIYYHKSQYSLMLVLHLGFLTVYRRYFKSKWTFAASVAVLVAGLVVSHTYAAMFAALFIPFGVLADKLHKKHPKFRAKYLLWLIPAAALLGVAVYVISKERNIFTLGSRTYIWKSAVDFILHNPMGVGKECGGVEIPIHELGWNVYNGHNVFLNFLLQFSVPAGLCMVGMLIAIGIAAFRRNLSFTTLGIFIALLIPMNMDWSLLPTEYPIFLLTLYLMFFLPSEKSENPNQ